MRAIKIDTKALRLLHTISGAIDELRLAGHVTVDCVIHTHDGIKLGTINPEGEVVFGPFADGQVG